MITINESLSRMQQWDVKGVTVPAMHLGCAVAASPSHAHTLITVPVTFRIFLSIIVIAGRAGFTIQSPFNSSHEVEIDVCWKPALFLHLYKCGHHMLSLETLLSYWLPEAIHPVWEITRGYNKRWHNGCTLVARFQTFCNWQFYL